MAYLQYDQNAIFIQSGILKCTYLQSIMKTTKKSILKVNHCEVGLGDLQVCPLQVFIILN